MKQLELHRPRVFKPSYTPAVSIANNGENLVATGNEHGLIELFHYPPEALHKPQYKGQFLTEMSTEAAALCFVAPNRLVSAGPGGTVSLWNCDSFQETFTEQVAVAIWQLEVCPVEKGLFAAACDDAVRLYQYCEQKEELELVRVFPVQRSRVLSVTWSPCGMYIFSGGVAEVKVWKVDRQSSGLSKIIPYEVRSIRISVSHNTPSTIWKLQAISAQVLVTGDSSNRIMFWDARTGTTISEFKVHEAPIISIALSPDRKTVYCSGSDSRIYEFNLDTKSHAWTQGSHYFTTTPYDITAFTLLANSSVLLATRSNGDVSSFTLQNNNISASRELAPIPRRSEFVEVGKNLEILTKTTSSVELFRLSPPQVGGKLEVGKKRGISVQNGLKKYCAKVFSYQSNDFLLDAVYRDSWLAVATKKYVKVYRFDEEGDGFEELAKVQLFSTVTALAIDTSTTNQAIVFLGFGDGTITSRTLKATCTDQEPQETLIKKRSSKRVPQKLLLHNQTLVYSTFTGELYTIDLSEPKSKPQDLPANLESVEYLESSEKPDQILVGTVAHIFEIDLESRKMLSSRPIKQRTLFHRPKLENQAAFHVGPHRFSMDNHPKVNKIARKCFPRKTNVSGKILAARLCGEKLVLVEHMHYAALRDGPAVHDTKRRKFGR